MRIAVLIAALAALASAADKQNQLTKDEKQQGFMLLFNGKDLEGWDGDPGAWSVKDGAIVGSSDGHTLKQNTFLIYRQPFSDFVLRAEGRLRNNNSGIQFRSRVLEPAQWIVSGYQADMSDAPGDKCAWGNFYEERGRSRTMMKTPDEGYQRAKRVLREKDWNEYEIFAQGAHIRLKLNNVITIDTDDDKWPTGIVALQLHAGAPMKVEFRNIRIKRLGAKP